MKTIKVPRKKCPLDAIADMGKAARTGLFIIDHNCYNQLCKTSSKKTSSSLITRMEWDEFTNHKGITVPKTIVYLMTIRISNIRVYLITCIEADDISFSQIQPIISEIYIFIKEEDFEKTLELIE